jgi:hypothetical protein
LNQNLVPEKMDNKIVELESVGAVEVAELTGNLPSNESKGNTSRDDQEMAFYGKRQQLKVCLHSKSCIQRSN